MNAVTLTPEKLALHIAHDLRTVSIHEAAHVVVAMGYDVSADARVMPTFTTDPWEEKQFIGQARFFRYGLDAQQLKMISLAGTVAEYCDGDPDTSGMDIMDCLQFDSLSATDAEGAGEYTEDDLDLCIALIREAWAEIEALAAELAEEGMSLYREMQEAGK